MLSLTATGSTSELDGLMARLGGSTLQDACAESGHAIQATYEQNAPKDTRSMSLSVYVHGADGQSDYGTRTAAADAVNPRVAILPELPAPPKPGAVVGVAASHGVHNEFGTSRMPARPTFTDAVETERARFVDRVNKAIWHG
jgi:hypothetical protein